MGELLRYDACVVSKFFSCGLLKKNFSVVRFLQFEDE
jgi:hypothetical protein